MKGNCLAFVLILFPILLPTGAVVYYISAGSIANNTCVEDGISLSPCYSLAELNDTMLSDQSSLSLLFLSGTHTILSDLRIIESSVAISPRNNHQEVKIQCQAAAGLFFVDDEAVAVDLVKFTGCNVQFRVLSITGHLSFTACIFTFGVVKIDIHRVYGSQVRIGNCTFNGAGIAYTSYVYSESSVCQVSNSTFSSSVTTLDGGAILVTGADLYLMDCWFRGNSAASGGAIHSTNSFVSASNTSFIDNSASVSGGAIYSSESHLKLLGCDFRNNSAQLSGGAVYFKGSLQQFKGFKANGFSFDSITFAYNRAGMDGGALHCEGEAMDEDALYIRRTIGGIKTILVGTSNLASGNGGFLYLERFQFSDLAFSEMLIFNNSALNGGAIYAIDSILQFPPTNVSHNRAHKSGGGLYLDGSRIVLENVIEFEYNIVTSVTGRGGAIFIADESFCEIINSMCFLHFLSGYTLQVLSGSLHGMLTFYGNTAQQGPILFGGLLDRCIPYELEIRSAVNVFKSISSYEPNPLAITSDPLKVCLCANESTPDCSVRELNFTKMRGESVTVTIAALDQNGNTVQSIVTAGYTETLSAKLQQGERSRQIPNRCTEVSYHVYTDNSTEAANLVLEPSENPCEQSQLSTLTLRIKVLPCSRGFEQQEDLCTCDRRLTNTPFSGIVSGCDIETLSIQSRGSMWLRYDEDYLRVHTNCPLDYCRGTTDTVISLSSPDAQCADSRSGVLCGSCAGKHSIVLGGSKCKDCTSSHAFIWLTLVFAAAGVALVALLLGCNITTSAGTLNGLIFYANVVSTSGLPDLQNCSISPVLSVFVAWLNLDLGVETCFYSGMDAYQKAWLQFAFPVYMWVLVGSIIVASYYSSRAMRVFGRNNIAVLATLFLLSYSKLLKSIGTALSFTQVWRGAAEDVRDQLVPYKVWTQDGNVEFVKGPHVVLFVAALLFLLVLFLPYTLLLLLGQCVRSMTVRRRGLLWIRSTGFISILDAYHAPYNRNHRYWTGLLLLTRCVLFLVFATNSRVDPLLPNMFAVTLTVGALSFLKIRLSKIYRNPFLEVLELFFLFNLGVLSATLLYLKGSNAHSSILCRTTTSSIAISFLMFLGILVYHAYLRMEKTRYYTAIRRALLNRWPHRQQHVTPASNLDSLFPDKSPTSTTVELREKLLESTQ